MVNKVALLIACENQTSN